MEIQIIDDNTNLVDPIFIKACRILIRKYKKILDQEPNPELKKSLLVEFWKKDFSSDLYLSDDLVFKKIVFQSEYDKILFLLKFN